MLYNSTDATGDTACRKRVSMAVLVLSRSPAQMCYRYGLSLKEIGVLLVANKYIMPSKRCLAKDADASVAVSERELHL